MLKAIIFSMITLTASYASANEVVNLFGYGEYRLGEFDSAASAKKLAEQFAVKDIAEQAQGKILSIQKIDKNGFYSRASWVVNSSLISKTVKKSIVTDCDNQAGRCAKVWLEGSVDTRKASLQLEKLYSDMQLVDKIEKLIAEENIRRKAIIDGESIDMAYELERLSKLKTILDYISAAPRSSKLGGISSNALGKYVALGKGIDKATISDLTSTLDYQFLLTEVKSNLVAIVTKETPILHSNGTGGLRLEVMLNSSDLNKPMKWVAERFGVEFGGWEGHYQTTKSNLGNLWWYETDSLGSMQAGVIIGDMINKVVSPDEFYLQYGVNSESGKVKETNNPDYRLNLDKLNFIDELSKYELWIDFKVNDITKKSISLISGGKHLRQKINASWDVNAPYLSFAKNESKFNVFLPLDRKTLKDYSMLSNVSYSYSVRIEAKKPAI